MVYLLVYPPSGHRNNVALDRASPKGVRNRILCSLEPKWLLATSILEVPRVPASGEDSGLKNGEFCRQRSRPFIDVTIVVSMPTVHHGAASGLVLPCITAVVQLFPSQTFAIGCEEGTLRPSTKLSHSASESWYLPTTECDNRRVAMWKLG